MAGKAQSYLAVHNYGMGGVWCFIDAPGAEAVREMYPELTVFEEPPDDMPANEIAVIDSEPHPKLGATRGLPRIPDQGEARGL